MKLDKLYANTFYDTFPFYKIKDGDKIKLFKGENDYSVVSNVTFTLNFRSKNFTSNDKVCVFDHEFNRYYSFDDKDCVIPVIE